MNETGNVLQQEEIDELFTHATGTKPEKPEPDEIIKVKTENDGSVAKKSVNSVASPDTDKVKPVSAVKESTKAAVHPDEAMIQQIVQTLNSITGRIDSIEKTIAGMKKNNATTSELVKTTKTLAVQMENDAVKIRNISDHVVKIIKELKGTPGNDAKQQFVCGTCGSKGHLAIPMKCTRCGTEGWWGWWPDK